MSNNRLIKRMHEMRIPGKTENEVQEEEYDKNQKTKGNKVGRN